MHENSSNRFDASKYTQHFRSCMDAVRPFLAVACLLLPTVVAGSATQSDAMYVMRACLGSVAFMVLMQKELMDGPFQAAPGQVKGAQKEFEARESTKSAGAATSQNAKEQKDHVASSAVALQFTSETFEDQVSELLLKLVPNAACQKATEELGRVIQQQLRPVLPEIGVKVLVSGPFLRSTPYAAAVPEIEVIVRATEDQLSTAMQRTFGRKQAALFSKLNQRAANKTALRMLIKHLLEGAQDFRFRRSSFSLPEAKVTLVAPKLGTDDQLVAFDLSLNASQPAQNAQLIASCAKHHLSAKCLVLLVRRWAKVRGICNAGMGYFSSYVWTLLVIYYLQVSDLQGSNRLLPAFQCFKDGLSAPRVASASEAGIENVDDTSRSPGWTSLLLGFFEFYCEHFDWEKEDLDIRVGRRIFAGASCARRLRIWDPFDRGVCLAAGVSQSNLARMRQELTRGMSIVRSESASLAQLVEQWVPEHVEGATAEHAESHEAEA